MNRMVDLRLFTLGSTHLERGGLLVKLPRRKMLALLAYLAVTGKSFERDTLIGLLWPEFSEDQAHAYLRNSMWSLREILGEEWGCFERDLVGLEQIPDFWNDVIEFRRLLSVVSSHSHLPNQICSACLPPLYEAVQLYQGDFMAGFYLKDCEQFNEWQFYEAESLRRELAETLNRLALGKCAQRQFDQAIHYARRYLALDKFNEQAQALVIKILAWTGQSAVALRQYQVYAILLEKEFGVLPSEETIALYQSIQVGSPPALPKLL